MTEIIAKIINSLGWHPNYIVKTKHGSCPEINATELVSAIFNTETIPNAAKVLGIGEQTLNRLIARELVPLFGKLNGGHETWKLKLITNAEIKRCCNCNQYLDISNFTKESNTFDGLTPRCISCNSIKNKKWYAEHKDTYYKQYIKEHRNEYNARNAYRRAIKLKATPIWANKESIKEFYKNRPVGFHVDHIYPLISDWVCGFHVETNLQYLTAEENMRKGNRKI